MKQAVRLSLLSSAMAEVALNEKCDTLDNWQQSSWKPEAEMQAFEIAPLDHDSSAKTLATTQDARFYAASTTFQKPLAYKGKSLLVQYEVTYDKSPECGGGYVKLGETLEDASKFGDPTPYYIMFGPDQCGYTKRTHLIFTYKGKNILKKTDLPYKQGDEGTTSVYRLVVTPAGKVTVRINDEEVYSGDLESDWELLPKKEVDDKDDKKPSDWIDDAMMDDADDTKPDDWLEVKEIPDAEAKKPDDWDAEEDGEWEVPMIPNPEYKGEWKPKRISNPEYKGVWSPKKVPNPEYGADESLYLLGQEDPKLGWLGLDLWQVKGGSRFDNFIVSASADDAELTKEADAAVATWKTASEAIKTKVDAAKADADKKSADEAAKAAAEAPETETDDDVDVDEDDKADNDDL